jgi:hypothetical protein|tara:strand:+ start:1077 stop:1220 length:144 start_codon:yes stop_codon:yes gene_type:complete
VNIHFHDPLELIFTHTDDEATDKYSYPLHDPNNYNKQYDQKLKSPIK